MDGVQTGGKYLLRSLLVHWFENVIQDNILFGMDEDYRGWVFQQYKTAGRDYLLLSACGIEELRGTEAHGTGQLGICHRLIPWTVVCTGSGGGTAVMSITAYKVEVVGHDRTGEDYGYVNVSCTAMAME